MRRGGDISPKRRIYFSNSRWTNQNSRRRSGTENIHLDTAADQIEERVTLTFFGESEGSFPQPHDSLPVAGEAMHDFWSMSGSFIYRHHVEPRVELYSPREESFPIPLKYIDVTRTTHTNLDVKQEKRIDDYWNIDGSRDLSDPWTGFTQFTLLDEKSSRQKNVVRGEIDEKTACIQARSSMAELWKSMGKNAKLKESKSGLKKRFILTMQENCVESISSTPRIRSTKKPSRMRVRNWKRQLLLLCPAKL